MIRPRKRGLMIRLPIMDTDPNRGITFGIMPIWVIQGKNDDRIEQIHAPSLTLNKNFKLVPTYRFYYYPKTDSTLILRASYSKFEREAIGQYEDASFLGREIDVFIRTQYNVDAGQRFYGLGPTSPKTAEANYREEYLTYRIGGGIPLVPGSRWRAHLYNHLQSGKLSNGPLTGLRDFAGTYPGEAPTRFQQTDETRLVLDYDSRDHGVTTTKGALLQIFGETSVRGLASSYDYNRYGLDARYFHPWAGTKQVSAFNFRYEQLLNDAPFWLKPRLGGKYSLRSYGDGRYVDRGMAAANAEQRFTLFSEKMAGVTTEFELAPFAGVGEVFDNPGLAQSKHLRTVFGAGVRAVARPQVVGSIDFGVGREGLAVFMDINYSF